MSQKKQDKIQKQKKVQGIYRKIKQQSRGDKNDNKIGVIIVNICVVLAILALLLNAFIKEF